MEVESYNSVMQDVQMLLTLRIHDRSAVYDHHVTLWFAPGVIVRIKDAEILKVAQEFRRLGITPDWFVQAVERVLRKRHKRDREAACTVNVGNLLKAAQLYPADSTLAKLVAKIVADRMADELTTT